MTVSLFVRHKVQDFDTWKGVYDGAAQLIKDNGVIADSVHRSLDDPNSIIVYHQFADTAALEGFKTLMDSNEFKEGPEKAGGVLPGTMEMWVGEDA